MNSTFLFLCVLLISLQLTLGFLDTQTLRTIANARPDGLSRLYSHHPQKKVIKKIMDRRPKKSRPSDINRNNVNLNVQFAQLEEYKAIPDYTVVSYEQYLKEKDEIDRLLEEGDPDYPWEIVTQDESVPVFNRNRKQMSNSELKKVNKHPLWKNRDPKNYRSFVPSDKMQRIIDQFEGNLIKVDDFDHLPTKPNFKVNTSHADAE